MTTTVPREQAFVRNQRLVSRRIDDQILVVPIRGGVGDLDSIYSFNSVGSEIWDLLAKEMSADEIVQHIVSSYDVKLEQAQSDVQVFLSELSAMGLIVQAANSASSAPLTGQADREGIRASSQLQ